MHTTKRGRLTIGLLAAGMALTVPVACGDDPVSSDGRSAGDTESMEVPGAAEAPASVRAEVTLDETTGGDQVVTIRLEPLAGALASYQAELRIAGGAEVAEVRTRDSDYHVVNEETAPDGKVRLAGFAAEAFSAPPRFELRLAPDETIRAEDLALDVEVAGVPEGEEIPGAEIDVEIGGDAGGQPLKAPAGPSRAPGK